MKRLEVLRFGEKSTLAPLLGIVFLAGCEGDLPSLTTSVPIATSTTIETVVVDVPAPEAFNITDTALWDGRPTFGGIWIAYPDIAEPERVRIRNDSNGKEVIGALYRREREFPGPKIELSADAAAALSVLAGVPTELTIIALRRKTVEVEVPAEDVVSTAADGMTTPIRRPSSEEAAVAAPTAPTEVTPEPEPDVKVEVETPAPTVAAPIKRPSAETTAIEETTLPPAPNFVPNAETVNIYIQVATFQNKAVVDEVVKKLMTAGLNVEIRERETEDKTLYRIIVGPANSTEAAEIMMSVVVELGYKDAFVLG